MDHVSLIDKEAMELYGSDKAVDYRNQLNMLSYWLTMLDRRYKSIQADYVKYLKLEEKK